MDEPLALGRYTLLRKLAAGGMATVYVGRISGAAGFGRTVAIKRLHPHLARDQDLVSRFVDEARLVACVRHPNVVPTLDVVARDDEIFLVLEYVQGESLAALLKASSQAGALVPVPVALSMAMGMLNGLHAAHEAKDEKGRPLEIIHRDVSPQNVLVGVDGVAHVLDFGVAKAANRLVETTRDGQLRGKVAYMAPEQFSGSVTRRADIYAAGVVLWETLTCRALFRHENELQLLGAILAQPIEAPSRWNRFVPPEVDRIVMRALSHNPEERYPTALEMAEAIDACGDVASSLKVSEWVKAVGASLLAARNVLIAQVEGDESARDLAAQAGSLTPGTAPSFTIRTPPKAGAESRARTLWPLLGGGALVLGFASYGLHRALVPPPEVDVAPAKQIANDPSAATVVASAAPVAEDPPSAEPVAPLVAAPSASAVPSATPAPKLHAKSKPAQAVPDAGKPHDTTPMGLATDRKG